MTELESLKYFPAEFAESQLADEPSPQGERERLATAQDLGMADWTLGLTMVTIFFGVAGTWGIVGGGIDIISAATVESSLAYIQKMSGLMENSEYVVAAAQNNVDNVWVLYMNAVLRILLGAGFLAAAAALKTHKEDANRFAALVCIGTVFYTMIVLVSGWALMPDPALLGGDPEIINMIMMFAMTGMVISFGINLAIYGGIVAYMLNRNNRRLFGRKVSTLDANYASSGGVGDPAM